MLQFLASNIMPRTTVDIDSSVLRQVKRIAEERGKSIASVISELLAAALAKPEPARSSRKLRWRAAPMRARVDLEDKEALHRALDR
jgi:hypothetical protein